MRKSINSIGINAGKYCYTFYIANVARRTIEVMSLTRVDDNEREIKWVNEPTSDIRMKE